MQAALGDTWVRVRTACYIGLALAVLALLGQHMEGLHQGMGISLWTAAICGGGVYIVLMEWPKLQTAVDDGEMWMACGWTYLVSLPSLSAVYLLVVAPKWVLAGVAVTVLADVAAYFCGRAVGGPKLWPSISPKKTWAGLIGAMAVCSVVALLVPWPQLAWYAKLPAVWLVVAVGVAGDMFESYLKRRAGVKDSGTLLPGHGGLFDRLDSHIAVLPVMAVLYALLT
ncbi:MAG: phosphatidate cytidylyltransferase [Proteobacteria bacterium]|nr:phosphatidate cytidylyltransferase [Pseudomonadota bacterium]